MNLLRYGGMIVGLYAALAAGFHCIRSRRDVAGVGSYPLATLLLVGAVGLPSTLQYFVPKMLPNLQLGEEDVVVQCRQDNRNPRANRPSSSRASVADSGAADRRRLRPDARQPVCYPAVAS